MHQDIRVVGLDLAKRVFQVHAIGDDGKVVSKHKLRRSEVLPFFSALPPCLIGMEACASAHHRGREFLARGHDVRLMPPAYVKPYVKRGKTDAADAEAICEAVTRPNMRFVAVKSRAQQGVLMLHKTRDLLDRQRAALINALRAHLAEFGLITATGPGGVKALAGFVHEQQDDLPSHARTALLSIIEQLESLGEEIERLEKKILASAIAAAVPDPGQFRSGRQFAAWPNAAPQQLRGKV